jgi:hypothetical protein
MSWNTTFTGHPSGNVAILPRIGASLRIPYGLRGPLYTEGIRMSSAIVFAIKLLEGIFLTGLVGCIAVLVLTGIEDLKTLFGRDDHPARAAEASHVT